MKTKVEKYKETIEKLESQKKELLELHESIERILQLLTNRKEKGNMLEGEEKYIKEESIRLAKCKQDIEKCNEQIENTKQKLGKKLLRLDNKKTK